MLLVYYKLIDLGTYVYANIIDLMQIYWGEPERAPHKREIHAVGLSVCLSLCLSFCPYVHDNTKIYKSNINLRDTFSC